MFFCNLRYERSFKHISKWSLKDLPLKLTLMPHFPSLTHFIYRYVVYDSSSRLLLINSAQPCLLSALITLQPEECELFGCIRNSFLSVEYNLLRDKWTTAAKWSEHMHPNTEPYNMPLLILKCMQTISIYIRHHMFVWLHVWTSFLCYCITVTSKNISQVSSSRFLFMCWSLAPNNSDFLFLIWR